MKWETERYKFKKGQRLHLDDIYDIQGIPCGIEWWEQTDPDDGCGGSDDLIVTKDIEIVIKYKIKD